MPLYKLLGGKYTDSVPVYFCVWNGTEEEAIERAQIGLDKGYFMFQVKVAGNVMNAANRVRKIREMIGPDKTLIVDNNTGDYDKL